MVFFYIKMCNAGLKRFFHLSHKKSIIMGGNQKKRKIPQFFHQKKVTYIRENTVKCRIYGTIFFAQYMLHFCKSWCSLNVFSWMYVKNLGWSPDVCQFFWQTSSRSLFSDVPEKCQSPENAPKLAKIGGTRVFHDL